MPLVSGPVSIMQAQQACHRVKHFHLPYVNMQVVKHPPHCPIHLAMFEQPEPAKPQTHDAFHALMQLEST
jgi:hypothetical protein